MLLRSTTNDEKSAGCPISPLPRTGTSGRGPANIVLRTTSLRAANIVLRTTSQPMFAPRSGGVGGEGLRFSIFGGAPRRAG